MVQQTTHKWRIENSKGVVLQADITAHTVYQAQQYAKNWCSSFIGWDFMIILLEEYA